MILLWLLATLVASSTASLDATTITDQQGLPLILPGAAIENIGTVYPITRLAEIKVDTTPLTNLKSTLTAHTQNLTHLRHLIENDESLQHGHAQQLLNSIDYIMHRVIPLTHDNVTSKNNNTRSKRGLFNFVGVISNALFGTVDEYTLNDRLDEYDDKIRSVSHSFQTNTAALKAIIHNTKALQTAYEGLQQASSDMYHQLDSWTRFVQLTSLVSQYKDTLNDITLAAGTYQRDIIAASRGQISPSLISPSDIHPILQKLLTDHNEIPLFQPSNLPSFYATLSSYVTPHGLSVILPIHPDMTLVAREVHPFPHYDNASETYITMDAPQLLLTTPTNTLYTAHSSAILHSCISPSPRTFVCLNPSWLYTQPPGECERALSNNPSQIPGACSFSSTPKTQHPYMLALDDVTLLYYFQATPVTIICDTTLPMIIISGPYSLPHKCKLQSINFSLPQIKHYKMSLTAEPHLHLPLPLVPIPISHPNHTSLNISFTDIPKLETAPHNFNHYFLTYAYAPLVFSVMFTLIIVAIGLHAMYERRQYTQEQADNKLSDNTQQRLP